MCMKFVFWGLLLLWVTVICWPVSAWNPIWLQPEQIHLSATGDPTEMMVTWSTFNDTHESVVEFGLKWRNLSMTATNGNRTQFVDGGWQKHTQYIHRVKLRGLKTGYWYTYRCGSSHGWSPLFTFRALPDDTQAQKGLRFALYGDMGNDNAQSLARLQVEAQSGLYDAILHVGDFAYDFHIDNARVGDEFMRQIESAAAYVPYMTCPGNHEQTYNFSNYKNRFTMPNYEHADNLWYSWDIGPAHIISFSTEVYFFEYGREVIKQQLAWLTKDLKEAAKAKNRAKHPWIITMGHRPMYCAGVYWDDCTKIKGITRTVFEDLFYKYGVDLVLAGHEHSYERMWPVYNNYIYNGSMESPYTNPKAPIHLITGSAGCREKHTDLLPPKTFTAFQNNDYGYTRMTIINTTHIYLEQVSDDQGGKIIDKFTIVKDQHGPEAWL